MKFKQYAVLGILLCLMYFTLSRLIEFKWYAANIEFNDYSDKYEPKQDVKEILRVSVSNTSKARSSKRFAVFACAVHSPSSIYLFYAPISAAAWQRLGYEVIVVFVGDFASGHTISAHTELTQRYLKRLGANVLNMQCDPSYAIKISQLVRVFVGLLPEDIVRDEDSIITADADIIPIDSRQYEPVRRSDGFLINSYCCGTVERRKKSYRVFAMSYIFLSKRIWTALLLESVQRAEFTSSNFAAGYRSKDETLSFHTISMYARQEFKDTFDQNMTKGDFRWYMDQIMCSMLLTDYLRNHPDLIIVERNLTQRLDRESDSSFWNRTTFEQFGDAHLPHEIIFKTDNWNIFSRLLRFLFTPARVEMFNDYYQQYEALRRRK